MPSHPHTGYETRLAGAPSCSALRNKMDYHRAVLILLCWSQGSVLAFSSDMSVVRTYTSNPAEQHSVYQILVRALVWLERIVKTKLNLVLTNAVFLVFHQSHHVHHQCATPVRTFLMFLIVPALSHGLCVLARCSCWICSRCLACCIAQFWHCVLLEHCARSSCAKLNFVIDVNASPLRKTAISLNDYWCLLFLFWKVALRHGTIHDTNTRRGARCIRTSLSCA